MAAQVDDIAVPSGGGCSLRPEVAEAIRRRQPDNPLAAAVHIKRSAKKGHGRTMAKVAVVIKDREQQYEGLRSSLGLLLYATEVQMFVLDHEIANMDEAYQDNMGFLDEMEGERFSNNPANVEKYGFKYATTDDIAAMLASADIIIPF
jgi:hypothetical protein